MSVIQLHENLSNPLPLVAHLEGSIDITGLKETSLVFQYRDGVVRLYNETRDEGVNCMPWLPIIRTDKIHSIFLDNLTEDFLHFLPQNITTFYYSSHKHLMPLTNWIQEGRVENLDTEVRLKYLGPWEKYSPVFSVVNRHIRHLEVPLSQDINSLLSNNPHLKTVGYDFDHQQDHSVLKRNDIRFVIWSAHPHNMHISHQLSPDNKKILFTECKC